MKRKWSVSILSYFAGFLLILLMLNISGCAALDRMTTLVGFGTDVTLPETPESLAMQGMYEFNHGRYSRALKFFEDIKSRFPFSGPAMLAKLKAADSKYHLRRYDDARILYEEFEISHPTNEAIPYVLFQMAMCDYNQIDTIDRDPGSAVNAIHGFSRLIQMFPQSPYIEEARLRIRSAENFMASHEMYVAMFYLRTGEYDQAKGRLQYLLVNYSHTDIAPDAEKLLVALKAGDPPDRAWYLWIPDIFLPSLWKSIVSPLSENRN